MKTYTLFALSLLSLVSGSAARSRIWFGSNGLTPQPHHVRTRAPKTDLISCADDDNEPINERSRVTAFVNTDDGLRVQCWEIGDLIPDSRNGRMRNSKGTVRSTTLASDFQVSILSFIPGARIFGLSTDGVQSTAEGVDFRGKPNLFTVKDGLIIIDAEAESGGKATKGSDEVSEQHVFADVNGDDWFYFEDASSDSQLAPSEKCTKSSSTRDRFSMQSISGSATTLINFEYQETPRHRVLHEGRCNFAGLQPSGQKSDSDAGGSRFRTQHQL